MSTRRMKLLARRSARMSGKETSAYRVRRLAVINLFRFFPVEPCAFVVHGTGKTCWQPCRQPRSEERRVGKECVSSVDLGGRRLSTQKTQPLHEEPNICRNDTNKGLIR